MAFTYIQAGGFNMTKMKMRDVLDFQLSTHLKMGLDSSYASFNSLVMFAFMTCLITSREFVFLTDVSSVLLIS